MSVNKNSGVRLDKVLPPELLARCVRGNVNARAVSKDLRSLLDQVRCGCVNSITPLTANEVSARLFRTLRCWPIPAAELDCATPSGQCCTFLSPLCPSLHLACKTIKHLSIRVRADSHGALECGQTGGVSLAAVLASCPQLITLTLNQSDFGEDEKALSIALRNAPNLQRLDFDFCAMKGKLFAKLAPALIQLPKLKWISVQEFVKTIIRADCQTLAECGVCNTDRVPESRKASIPGHVVLWKVKKRGRAPTAGAEPECSHVWSLLCSK